MHLDDSPQKFSWKTCTFDVQGWWVLVGYHEDEHANPLTSGQWMRNKGEDMGADDAMGQGC